MVDCRLILINERQTSPTTDDVVLDNCPFSEDIGIAITLKIADIRDPGSVDGSFTKPISIPGTPEVNKFFEDIYDVNVALSYYDPNLKVKAYYYEDTIQIFDGYLQILKIDVDEISRSWVYQCNIIGEVINLFTKCKNKFVHEMDFSAYNHALTYANISASWANTPGSGIIYPMHDFGTNNSNLSQMKPTDFRGCIYYREVLQKMFTAEGYSWTSNFLDSAFFRKLYFTPTETPALNQTVLNANKFLATANGSQTHIITLSTLVGNFLAAQFPNTLYTCNFPTETYDAGNIYNNSTYKFTVQVNTVYNLSVNLGLNLVVKRNGIDVSANITGSVSGIHVILYNETNQQIAGLYDFNISGASFAASNSNNAGVTINNVALIAGHVYSVKIRYNSINMIWNAPTSGASWTMETTLVTGSNFGAEFATVAPYEGATVDCNTLLPLNLRQSDFFKYIIETYNLRVMPDKSNPNNLIIEDEPNFYLNIARNWFDKHDKGSNVEVRPMGDLDYNKISARYSEDGDYYNTQYQTEYKESYGSNSENITNDFIKGEKVIQSHFAATPYAVNPSNQMVVPSIIKKDNNSIGEFKPKLRMLYWSGLINLPTGQSWTFVYNNGANSVVYTQQPHGGHTNNPYSPTVDLSFGVPKKIYYTFPNQQWTTNNIWNKYFKVDYQRRSDKNSKIIRTKFFLTPDDINIFDFRYPIFTQINNEQGYYLVHVVEDYNKKVSESTTVEILKFPDFDPFVESTYAINTGLGSDNQHHGKALNGNFTGGPNNINYAEYSLLQGGNDNFIDAGSESVTLLNSEGAAIVGVEKFMGVGLNKDSEYGSDMVNLMDKLKIYSDGQGAKSPRVMQVTGDFTIDGKYDTYEIDLDTIGLAVTCSWDAVAYPVQVQFKVTNNASVAPFYIDDMTSPPSSPPQTIDGNALPWTTGLGTNGSLIVYSNGTNLKIISST